MPYTFEISPNLYAVHGTSVGEPVVDGVQVLQSQKKSSIWVKFTMMDIPTKTGHSILEERKKKKQNLCGFAKLPLLNLQAVVTSRARVKVHLCCFTTCNILCGGAAATVEVTIQGTMKQLSVHSTL